MRKKMFLLSLSFYYYVIFYLPDLFRCPTLVDICGRLRDIQFYNWSIIHLDHIKCWYFIKALTLEGWGAILRSFSHPHLLPPHWSGFLNIGIHFLHCRARVSVCLFWLQVVQIVSLIKFLLRAIHCSWLMSSINLVNGQVPERCGLIQTSAVRYDMGVKVWYGITKYIW